MVYRNPRSALVKRIYSDLNNKLKGKSALHGENDDDGNGWIDGWRMEKTGISETTALSVYHSNGSWDVNIEEKCILYYLNYTLKKEQRRQ